MPSTRQEPGLLFGKPLDPRRNSLNLVRLILAFSVLFTHSFYIVGAGHGPNFRGETIGAWAVAGFFAVSGYLILASRISNRVGPYLANRVARIFPGFLACMAVTAFVFAPIAYRKAHGTLDGFMTSGTTPLQYLLGNMTLKMNAWDVAGTPVNVPYPGAWNGSLWSLYYEFLCYVLLAIVGAFGIFRRSALAMGALWALSVLAYALRADLMPYVQGNIDVELFLRVVPYFLAGSVLYLVRDQIGYNLVAGLVSMLAFVAIIYFVHDFGGQLAAPFIAYWLLWVGTWLPIPELVRKHDISYGGYIYAFPIQQLLVTFGVGVTSPWLLSIITTALTAVAATASWFLVERPVLTRVKGRSDSKVIVPTKVAEQSAATHVAENSHQRSIESGSIFSEDRRQHETGGRVVPPILSKPEHPPTTAVNGDSP